MTCTSRRDCQGSLATCVAWHTLMPIPAPVPPQQGSVLPSQQRCLTLPSPPQPARPAGLGRAGDTGVAQGVRRACTGLAAGRLRWLRCPCSQLSVVPVSSAAPVPVPCLTGCWCQCLLWCQCPAWCQWSIWWGAGAWCSAGAAARWDAGANAWRSAGAPLRCQCSVRCQWSIRCSAGAQCGAGAECGAGAGCGTALAVSNAALPQGCTGLAVTPTAPNPAVPPRNCCWQVQMGPGPP